MDLNYTSNDPMNGGNFDVEFLTALFVIFVSGFLLFYLGVPYIAKAFF
jgi:hypothetical protein